MGNTLFEDQAAYEAPGRLLDIARRDTGQSRRVANFLLAWHNAEENGGWDPTVLWNVDAAIADYMFTVLRLIRESNRYPDDIGFEKEIQTVWQTWRNGEKVSPGMSTRLIARSFQILQQAAAKFPHCLGGRRADDPRHVQRARIFGPPPGAQ
jgi:hypothetical protein